MSIVAIERALEAALASGVAPGLTAAAHLAGGSVWTGAYGQRGVQDPSPMTGDTLFWIASMTKAIASVAALQMVEQGRVSLDQPASDFVPAIGRSMIIEGFDAKGEARLRPATKPVTLRHLLTHTSGYGYAFFSQDLARYCEAKGLGLDSALDLPRLAEAGECWNYGVGIDFAGQVVEAITGQSLDVYLQQHVFDVLGMADTTFAPSPEQEKRKAAMHARLPDGGLVPMEFPLPPPPNPMLGGGGLFSTASDYLLFLTALLNGGVGANGGRILKAESMGLLSDNHVGEIQCGVLETAMPHISAAFEPFPGQPKRWSLAMLRTEAAMPGGRGAGSLAWAGLSNCYCWMDPGAGVAGVILMQFLPFADPKALEAFEAFERAVYA